MGCAASSDAAGAPAPHARPYGSGSRRGPGDPTNTHVRAVAPWNETPCPSAGQLAQRRAAFWESQTSGRNVVWTNIRVAAEAMIAGAWLAAPLHVPVHACRGGAEAGSRMVRRRVDRMPQPSGNHPSHPNWRLHVVAVVCGSVCCDVSVCMRLFVCVYDTMCLCTACVCVCVCLCSTRR